MTGLVAETKNHASNDQRRALWWPPPEKKFPFNDGAEVVRKWYGRALRNMILNGWPYVKGVWKQVYRSIRTEKDGKSSSMGNNEVGTYWRNWALCRCMENRNWLQGLLSLSLFFRFWHTLVQRRLLMAAESLFGSLLLWRDGTTGRSWNGGASATYHNWTNVIIFNRKYLLAIGRGWVARYGFCNLSTR